MTKFDPKIHHRHSIRLKGYDYTQAGAYFITIVTYQHQPLFGEVVNGEMVLNELGQIAQKEWFRTAELRSYVELFEDEFVVVPNHAHGIIRIIKNDPMVGGGADVGGWMGVGALRPYQNNNNKNCKIALKYCHWHDPEGEGWRET